VHVTQVLHLRLDVYLVKYFTSTAVVGQYALAVNVVDVILYAGRSVGLVVFARRALDPNPTAGPVPAVTRLMLVAVSLFATTVFLLRDPLIETFFGSVYLACTAAIACRLPGIVAESLSVVLVSDYLGRANTRPPLVWNGIAVGTGLVLNVLLVPHGGIVAAASAFSIASWTRAMGLVSSHARLSHGRWGGYFWSRSRSGSPWRPKAQSESVAATKSTEVGR
jgi:O-antigen/teichoic acid export membrane protein